MINPPNRRAEPTLVETRAGTASVRLVRPSGRPRGAVLLGHGAGGDSSAAVLVEVERALVAAGFAVARFDQPYRVAGRRAPARAPQLDAAAADVAAWLRRARRLGDVPLFVGGKSSGARVACRVAGAVGAHGVIALGFPLRPPARPDVSRAGELRDCAAPVLVCQGTRDAFGGAVDVVAAVVGTPHVSVHAVAGADHSYVARRSDGRTTAECLQEVARVTALWASGQVAAT